MKNFLSEIAERKGMTLPDLADRLEMAYQTLYGYASGSRRMRADVADRAGKILGVSGAEILQNYASEALAEDPAPYRVGTISLKLVPSELLAELHKALSRRSEAEPAGTHLVEELAGAIREITLEVRARGREVGGAQLAPSSSGPGSDEDISADLEAEADRALAQSPPRPAKPAPSAHRSPPPAAASRATRKAPGALPGKEGK